MKQYTQEKEAVLRTKVIPQNIPADFQDFWDRALAQLRAKPLEVKRTKITTPYDKTFTTWELSFNTHDDTWICAYFSHPANATGKLPCVVRFHGGSLSKQIRTDILSTGVCCMEIDVRGQGGHSLDKADYPMGNLNGDLTTRGLLDKEHFYMRNIYLDAVRTMDVVAQLPEVDPERIVTYGGSQGGALSIVASALSGHSKKCYSFVTSYCCLTQRVENATGVFRCTNEYLKRFPEHTDQVLDVLRYFDVNNLVSLLKVPASFCLGMADAICLPHFVYSVYTHANCPKDLMIAPFAPHGTVRLFQDFAYNEFTKL